MKLSAPNQSAKSAGAIASAVASGQMTAAEVTRTLCDAVESRRSLNAFITFDPDDAMRQAQAVDADPALRAGPLAGVPVAVKDNIQVNGQRLTCASKLTGTYISPYDATVVARLRAAGAVIFGKTNLDEFAMGSSCEYSAFGPTRNPWDETRVPGGSSGGSAAAVAAGLCPIALGSDTGGSIRQPAAFTGTVGYKPTYGRVSRWGLVAFGSSLDQIGPFTTNVADAARCLAVIGGQDPNDATTFREAAPDVSGLLAGGADAGGLVGCRVGWMPGHLEGCDPGVADAVRGALRRMEEAGATLVELNMPSLDYSVHAYYIIATSEASSNLSRFDGIRYCDRQTGDGSLLDLYTTTRGEGFGAEVKRRIMLGTFALSAGYQDAYYKRALKVRELMRREYAAAFERVDVIAGPTAPTPAFAIGSNTEDPLKMYLCDVFTIGANLSGIPALSLPCGLATPDDGTGAPLPVGLHVQGRMGDDAGLLSRAAAIEAMLLAG